MKGDTSMTIGDILKQYREQHNISMDEFSKKSSLSKGYISMLENNINPRNNKPIAPTLPTIDKIANGMGIDIDTLLKLLDNDQQVSINPHPKTTDNANNFSLSLLEKNIILEFRKADDITKAIILRTLALDKNYNIKGDVEKMA